MYNARYTILPFLFSSICCFAMEEQQNKYPTLPNIHLQGHEGAVVKVLFSPMGDKIASGSTGEKNNLMIWDTKTATLLHNCEGHTKEITVLRFSRDGKYLLSGSEGNSTAGENNLLRWNVETGTIDQICAYHPYAINDAAWSPDNKLFASASNGSNVQNLALWTKEFLVEGLAKQKNGVHMVRFINNTTLVSSSSSWYGGPAQTILFWNCENGAPFKTIHYADVINDLAFNYDCTQYAGTRYVAPNNLLQPPGMDCILTIWNMEKDTEKDPKNILVGHRDKIMRTTFSPSNKKIVSSASDTVNNLIVWDNETGNISLNLVGHASLVFSAQFSPDEEHIVSGGDKGIGNLIVWKTKHGEIAYNLVGHECYVYDAQFSPDGNYIVSAGGECQSDKPGELILWKFFADPYVSVAEPCNIQ